MKRIKGCDLYVVRLDKEAAGGLGESRPCHLCLEWLRAYGIKRVFFSIRISDSTGDSVRWIKQV